MQSKIISLKINGLSRAIIIFFFIALANLVNAQEKVSTTLLPAGQTVPNFKFELEKGKISTIKEYKGKIVLVNFFATWCSPCRKELPLIEQRIWAKHKDNSKFAMLTFGREHNWDEVSKFKEDQKLTFPILPDPERKVYSLFATQTIPRCYLLDEKGVVIFSSEGYDEKHFTEMVQLIESKLK